MLAIVTIALAVASPLRKLSGDTVPARAGALVLRCSGTFELDRVDWIRAETAQRSMFYYMQYDKQQQFTSVFGPVPALVGSLALLDIGDGDVISDEDLRARERWVGAFLVAIAAALLVLACRARASLPRSLLAGAVAASSFAGAATLGQGLWQATPALPFLIGALATLAWREQRPWLGLATPALLVAVVMIRPVVAPLALGIGLTWAIETGRDRRAWLVAVGLSVAVAAPFVVWNALHQNSPLSIAQWGANRQLTEHPFRPSEVPAAVAGLLASPGRGLLWFAPLALIGFAASPRTRWWLVAGGILQVLAMAAFFKWHGGQAYGPRLLSELTWIGVYLALGTDRVLPRALLAPAAAVTIVVGQLGLWGYSPGQWERRRAPDVHPTVLWELLDSPIPATLTPPKPYPPSDDDPPMGAWRCERGQIRTEPAKL